MGSYPTENSASGKSEDAITTTEALNVIEEPAKLDVTINIDWSAAAEGILAGALGKVPYVGGILSNLVGVLWPAHDKTDVWSEMRDQTEALMNQKLAQSNYDRVAAKLGSQEEGTGMVGVLDNWNKAVDGSNKQDPRGTWDSANVVFINDAADFQQPDCEILLLPLFAQMANLHLGLLRDGVLENFCDISELREKTQKYTVYADKWVANAISNTVPKRKGDYNPSNVVKRFMQLNVGNFSRLWLYLDPVLYPNKVDIPLGPEIFYTVTDYIKTNYGQDYASPKYTPPGTRDGYVSALNGYVLNNDYGARIMWVGSDVEYDNGAGSTGFTGATYGPKPPQGGSMSDGIGVYTHFRAGSLTHEDPITSIEGGYCADQYVRWLMFSGRTDQKAGLWPDPTDKTKSTKWTFKINPPQGNPDTPGDSLGYWLSSMWVPSGWAFYYAAMDMVFGFQNYNRIAPTQTVSVDNANWAQNVPVKGSTNWMPGYSVQYTVQWVYADGAVSNPLDWCAPISTEYAFPTLILPISTDSTVVGRRIWRRFHGQIVETIGKVDDNTSNRFQDETY